MISRKKREFFAQYPKMIWKLLSTKLVFLIKVFLWTRRMHFWHPRPKFFSTKSLKTFRWMSEIGEKINHSLEKFFPSEDSFWLVKGIQLWQPRQKIVDKMPKSFCWRSKTDKRIIRIPLQNIFPQNGPMEHVESNFHTRAKNLFPRNF